MLKNNVTEPVATPTMNFEDDITGAAGTAEIAYSKMICILR